MPTTPRATRPPGGDKEDTTQTLAYWMGRVDASILEIKKSLDGLCSVDDKRWSSFEAWRKEVDERLQRGSGRFEDHDRRLNDLEEGFQKLNGNGYGNGKKPATEPIIEKQKFGSWDWFRDNYLEKTVMIVLTVIIYKIIEIVIAHWSVTGKIP